jgi:hypothetical protein
MPAGNLQVSAAVFFSGTSFSKIQRVLQVVGIQSISMATFYRHMNTYLEPTVLTVWHQQQQQLINYMVQQSGQVIIGGDMRADSPGHSAKYGSYTTMDLRQNRIVDIQLIQVLNY